MNKGKFSLDFLRYGEHDNKQDSTQYAAVRNIFDVLLLECIKNETTTKLLVI